MLVFAARTSADNLLLHVITKRNSDFDRSRHRQHCSIAFRRTHLGYAVSIVFAVVERRKAQGLI